MWKATLPLDPLFDLMALGITSVPTEVLTAKKGCHHTIRGVDPSSTPNRRATFPMEAPLPSQPNRYRASWVLIEACRWLDLKTGLPAMHLRTCSKARRVIRISWRKRSSSTWASRETSALDFGTGSPCSTRRQPCTYASNSAPTATPRS
jgi:hypothetical protein